VEQWRDLARAPRELEQELRGVKDGLEFVRVREDISPEIVPHGAFPGFWHVRDSSALPAPTFFPIAGASGGYREPDSGVCAELRSMDLRRPEVAERVFTSTARQEEARIRARDLRKEQERDVLKEDLKAGWRTKGRIYRDDGEKVKVKVDR
jgi:hypothetical protein